MVREAQKDGAIMGRKIVIADQPSIYDRVSAPDVNDEQREQRLCSLALDLLEERLRNGTATGPEILHFAKLGSERAKLEQEKLRYEAELNKAKADAIRDNQENQKSNAEVLKALGLYRATLDSMESEDYSDILLQEE